MRNTAEKQVTPATDALQGGLRAPGLRPLVSGMGDRPLAGLSLRVSVDDVLGDNAVADALLQRLGECRQRGVPVCLSVSDVGSGASVTDAWRAFCELIRPVGISPGFLIHSHQMPLQAYCLVADATLGSGPRFVFFDNLQMLPHHNAGVTARSEANWRFIWRRHKGGHPVLPVYGGFTRSACPLLSDEVADTVDAHTALHAPRNSAWLLVELHLPTFADHQGDVDEVRLLALIDQALPAMDATLDRMTWCGSRQQADARNNRRVAFDLAGIGDLVVRRNEDPCDLRCLNRLSALIERINMALRRRSADLAAATGALPALEQVVCEESWFRGSHGASWSRHFDRAKRATAMRHRNLLVMSPYAVLPRGAECRPAFMDLLPLIRHADAWRFAGMPNFSDWSLSQFKGFHCRARAVIQASHAMTFIAGGV